MSTPSPDKPDSGLPGWLVAILWVVGIGVLLIGICLAIVVTSSA